MKSFETLVEKYRNNDVERGNSSVPSEERELAFSMSMSEFSDFDWKRHSRERLLEHLNGILQLFVRDLLVRVLTLDGSDSFTKSGEHL